MTAKRKSKIGNYRANERRTLLTGVPISVASTRFGHPFAQGGWLVDEIRIAWELRRDELLIEWEKPEFDHYRERDPRPFAERILAAQEQAT